MAYRLIPVREADRQRILRDVACSHEHHAAVTFACKLDEFPLHWALEADTGNYLVGLMHEEIRPEFENYSERYAFCLAGDLFEVRFDNMFGPSVKIKSMCGALIRDAPLFREQVTRAFAAHGRYGKPGLHEDVVPEFDVRDA